MTEVQSRRIGRPPLTDRASLLAAARRLGFVGLTVGTVTAEVGVKYSTFYRHFPSFEHLQTAMVDDVLGEAEFPEPAGPWREHLARTSARMMDLLYANPGLAQAIMSLPERPHRLVELFRTSSEVLLDAGFGAPDAVLGAAAAYDLGGQPRRHLRAPLPQGAGAHRAATATGNAGKRGSAAPAGHPAPVPTPDIPAALDALGLDPDDPDHQIEVAAVTDTARRARLRRELRKAGHPSTLGPIVRASRNAPAHRVMDRRPAPGRSATGAGAPAPDCQ